VSATPPDRRPPSPKESSEAELLERARGGDLTAFEQLFEPHSNRLYRLAWHLLGKGSDAEDAVQEALLHAYQGLAGFRGESRFSTWLFRILLNACRMRLRQESRRESLSFEELGLAFDQGGVLLKPVRTWPVPAQEVVLRNEMRDVIRQGLAELPENYREVLVLVDMEGLSNQEAADSAEVSLSALKARLHRARLYLRHKLAGYFSELESG